MSRNKGGIVKRKSRQQNSKMKEGVDFSKEGKIDGCRKCKGYRIQRTNIVFNMSSESYRTFSLKVQVSVWR